MAYLVPANVSRRMTNCYHRMMLKGWAVKDVDTDLDPVQLSIFSHLNKYHRLLLRAAVMLLVLVVYCEWLHYFLVLLQCTWPRLQAPNPAGLGSDPEDVKVMFLADTHLLGSREGHWFDKLRREWQMQRAFQTSMLIHRPHLVFILGDLLDEGKWCSDEEFAYHVKRFDAMFSVPSSTQKHLVVGNHDVGFHYMMTPHKLGRFEEAFGSTSVGLLTVQGVTFVLLNSMAMEQDGCGLCTKAQRQLTKVSQQLLCAKAAAEMEAPSEKCQGYDFYDSFQYSKPILLQHFPLYRPSDVNCSTVDAAPQAEKMKPFQPKMDTLSKDATAQLFQLLDPRLVIDAHIHHGCFRVHDNGVPEWTVSSFNWRNKLNPAFLMARISSKDQKVHVCQMPDERTVIAIYIFGGIITFLSVCLPLRRNKLGKTS